MTMNKVIVILDNGMSWDDHTIYFVEVRARFLKDFEKLIRLEDTHDWIILGVAEKVKWHKSNQTITDFQRMPFYNFANIDNKEWAQLSLRYRRWLFQRWASAPVPADKGYKNDWDRLRGVK